MELTTLFAHTSEEFDAAKELFVEYKNSVNYSVCFPGFEKELAEIQTRYSAPNGYLLLVKMGDKWIGCGVLKKMRGNWGEIKRMYVKPDCRGTGVGRIILEILISKAIELGFDTLKLDTLQRMHQARKLYKSVGFIEVPPFRYNACPDMVYMEFKLKK